MPLPIRKSEDNESPEWIQTALSDFESWLSQRKAKERTRAQYRQIVRDFLSWSSSSMDRPPSLPRLRATPESLDELADYGLGWLDPSKTQSTLNLYCSVLSSYGRSIRLPVDFRAYELQSFQPHQVEGSSTPLLDDDQLRQIRRRAGRNTARRACVELAIAGLTAAEIAAVQPSDISYSRSERLATTSLAKGTHKVIFDLVSLKYFASTVARTKLPSQQTRRAKGGVEESAPWKPSRITLELTSALSPIVPGPPRRMLLEAGVRRAIARGVSPEAIAESVGYKTVPPRWWVYAKSPSRRTNLLYRPIVPESKARTLTEERKRAPISELSDAEFEALIDELEPGELSSED